MSNKERNNPTNTRGNILQGIEARMRLPEGTLGALSLLVASITVIYINLY